MEKLLGHNSLSQWMLDSSGFTWWQR